MTHADKRGICMAELSPEERERVLKGKPWGTLILMMLLLAGFLAGWGYMYFYMFLEHGPVH